MKHLTWVSEHRANIFILNALQCVIHDGSHTFIIEQAHQMQYVSDSYVS